VVDCSWDYKNGGCIKGGWPSWAFNYLEDYKLETAQDYPYTANTQKCVYNADKGVVQLDGYGNVTANDPVAMANRVA